MDRKYYKIAFFSVCTLSTGLVLWIWKHYWTMSSKPLKKTTKLVRKRSLNTLKSSVWENVGKVKNLWIYPIKSCAGISVEEAMMDSLGANLGQLRDRSLMIVDGKHQMITGRKISKTVLITSEFDASGNIILKFPDLQPLKLSLSMIEILGEVVETKVWQDDVRGLDCGDAAADWLKLALGVPCRLLFHGNLTHRKINKLDKYPLIASDDTTLYADGFPYMLMTEASLIDLQKRLPTKTDIRNFRPNISVEGSLPYDEDDWTYLKIGESIFRNVKPCDRCTFPSVNYKTAEKDKNFEPLRTLKKYRLLQGNDAPFFGINLCCDQIGKLKVGDNVYVLRD